MDIREVLLMKSLRGLLTNASHRYLRGRDQNEYKFTVR